MRLFAGIAISFSVLIGTEVPKRPEAFFTDGNAIIYTSTTKGKGGKAFTTNQVIKVEKVVRTSSGVYSECHMGYYLENRAGDNWTPYYVMRHSCDSLNFYVYAENWCYVPVHQEEYSHYECTGDSIAYPLHMSIGDTLPDAFASTQYSIYSTKIAYSINFTDRKVDGTDSIFTEFGKQFAYRLTMNMHFDVRSYETESGGDKNLLDTEITEWFSPQFGIIKSAYTYPDGAITATMISFGK